MYSTIGVASEAKKYSLSPIPITKGLDFLAAISSLGFSLSITTIAYAPTTSVNANLTASKSYN